MSVSMRRGAMCPCPSVHVHVSMFVCPFPCVHGRVSISMCPFPCFHFHVSVSMCPCPSVYVDVFIYMCSCSWVYALSMLCSCLCVHLQVWARFDTVVYSNALFSLQTSIFVVRYHSGGSMELNACILLLAHMVYL